MSTAGSTDPSLAPTVPRVGGSLKKVVAESAAAVVVVNAAIYLIADALGAFPDSVVVPTMAGEKPLGLGEVVFGSVASILAAGLLLGVLIRILSNPWRAFRSIALTVLVLSLGSPFTIENAPADMIATLLLMHVATAAIGLPLLSRFDGIVASGARS